MPIPTRDAFHLRVRRLLRDYEEMLLAVHQKTRQASLESMLSEQAAMSLGVYWEAFVHDLFVAYVTRNPVNCITDFRKRLDKNLNEKFNLPATWVRLSIPATLNSKHVERMLDPKGWNVNATSAQELRNKANQFLHSVDARNFSLSQEDAQFVDLLVAIRNYLAHRSTSSKSRFREAQSSISPTGKNAALAGDVRDLAAYLKGSVGAERRVHVIGRRLREVASALVP